jgi:hypothetical protein
VPPKTVLLQPENQTKKYEALFVEIDTGQIKLPMFQREFVWDKEQSAKLIDSILKGFPIGTFILWKTKEQLRSFKNIGNHKLPATPKGEAVQYILDGQQRITSLYAIRKGIRLTKDGKEIDYKDIFVDLSSDPDTDEQLVVTEQLEGRLYESVHGILSKQLGSFYRRLSQQQADLVEAYKTKLTGYDFSTITIKDYPIEIACEVFSRINTGGKILTVFEIMVAKTFDEPRKFDLGEQFELLRDGSDDEKASLRAAHFETIPQSVIMQSMAGLLSDNVRGKDILRLKRETFINEWKPMKSSLFMAVDFVRSELQVPVSQLLPYPALLVPLTYFFRKTKNRKPNQEQTLLLEQFFYWVGVTQRYSAGSEAKIAEDLSRVGKIASGKRSKYRPADLTIDPESIALVEFSAGNAFCKAVLCLLASNQPKSFDTNGTVLLDNSNLKIASSRNYHHFFPKKWLSEMEPDVEPNLLANITLLDGYSNKHRIGKDAPSKYISRFRKTNRHMGKTLEAHLILDAVEFGIPSDDYGVFIRARSAAIADALEGKLRPQI